MKRSSGSTGRGKSSRNSKSSKFSKPAGFSKSSGAKKGRGGVKPFNPSGDRSPRFKKEGDTSERGEYKRSPGRSTGSRSNLTSGTGPRPERFTREGDKPERGNFKRPFDKATGGGGTYLRRRDDRPVRTERESGDAETRGEFKPRPEKSTTPFRERRSVKNTGDFADKKKRKRIGEREKPFERRGDKGSTGRFKSSSSSPRSDSPKSFGEKRYEKRPPKDRKPGSFERAGDRTDKPWNRKEKHEFYGDRKKSAPEFMKTSEDGSTRLNKFIANAGICSRREADDMIKAGVISVNGEIITEMGYKVMPGDAVKYNNELLRSERLVYILLNKPKDFITTTDDPEDRKTVMNLIAKACKERVYPVGRLDRNTTGVLLFTNDGDLAKKLTHPSFQVQKIYQAELDRALKSSDMDAISAGVTLDDGFIKPDEIVYATKEKNIMGMELHSGKNRIVRRIFEHLGYEVKKLDRVVFAGLTKKDLPRGRWRFLTDIEIANLKMITGKKGTRATSVR